MKRFKYISLTGGLGNQLFQYAAALFESKNYEITLVSSLGSPRVSKSGRAEIYSFDIPELEKSSKANWLIRKVAGYLLRQGIYAKEFEKYQIFRNLTFWTGSIFLSLYFGKKVNLVIGKGVGFFQFNRPVGHQLLIGYFQTYRWASTPQVFERLQQIEPIGDTLEFQKYQNLAIVERPLVVHVRLGDYQNEHNFGILPTTYYTKAISDQLEREEYGSIWLFSDQLKEAQKAIPKNLGIRIRLIEEVNESAAATLQVMRLGYGYVIANSTFSWWGAFLSLNSDVRVVAPNPWFRNLPEPIELIPPHWTRLDAGWGNYQK